MFTMYVFVQKSSAAVYTEFTMAGFDTISGCLISIHSQELIISLKQQHSKYQ